METEIENVIQRLFPADLQDEIRFKVWCEALRQDAQPDAADLIARLDARIAALRNHSAIHRDHWELFGGNGDKTIKSASSIRSKLARDLMDEKTPPPQKKVDELKEMVLAFGDLGRVRIVVDFPSDVTYLLGNLINEKTFLEHYAIPKGIKDFVFDPSKRDGLRGHRAVQFSVRVAMDEHSSFGFEVQLMTRLQHAWDRRNHPLYEWQRENPSWSNDAKAVELAVDDFACAETLHLVDRQADQNWQRLQTFISGKQA